MIVCQICGQKEEKAPGVAANYGRDCWNEFHRRKYHMTRDSLPYTIKQYRAERAEEGLPVATPKIGRTRTRFTAEDWVCPTCRKKKTEKSEFGMCLECTQNWRRWAVVDSRISPAVFFVVQSTADGNLFAAPILGQPRQMNEQLLAMLDGFTPEVVLAFEKQHKQHMEGK